MTVRDATYNDLPAILEIYNDVIINTTAVYSYQPHTLPMRQQWFQERLDNGFPVFVSSEADVITGFSSYGFFRAWPAYKYTVEDSLYVHPAYRGKGIARQLLEPLLKDAVAKNYHAMIAAIDAENHVSRKVHQAFGFVEVAHFKEVGFKFGKWLDLKFFELLFETPEHPDAGMKNNNQA